jgi:hypothetical protein
VAGSDLRDTLTAALRQSLAARLEAMTPGDRRALVDAAREESRWLGEPDRSWLHTHARKHGHDRTDEQYRAWGQAIKKRPGTQVYAMIHPIHGTTGLAFIEPTQRVLVWYDLDQGVNRSCFYLDETVEGFLANKGDLYWRLPETEL